jgi:hypothetical protein
MTLLLLMAIPALPGYAVAGKTARANAKAPPAGFSTDGPRSLTVMDPVDLTTGLPDPESGAMLRRTLSANAHWNVLPGDTTLKRMREYGLDPDMPCMEFQCAFDAGNALQTEFVLFGTTTSLPEMHAYTLDLVHVPTSQVAWSRAGEAPKRGGERKQNRKGYILEGSLQFAVSDLEPASLNLRKNPSLGLLGVMDAGQSTPHSRVALHRALTHAYASRAYDLLGPAEMDELLAALDLRGGPADPRGGPADPRGGPADPRGGPADLRGGPQGGTNAAGAAPNGPYGAVAQAAGTGGPGGAGGNPGFGGSGSPEDMLSIGRKMGVRYLLWTKVETLGREYKLDMSLYDVAGQKLLRHWPARETADFGSLLSLEDRFLTVLGDNAPLSAAGTKSPSKLRLFGKVTSISLAAAAGGALGYMAYQSKTDADLEYQRFRGARSEQEASQARLRVLEQDTQTRRYGLLGGLSLALGVAVWAF